MATFIIHNLASSSLYLTHTSPSQPPTLYSPCVPNSPSVRFSGHSGRRRTRGLSVVTRGVPGPSTFVFAFVFPLSLLAVTIFTSIRIADKLDNDFLQELAINEAILEAAEDDDGEVGIYLEEETAVPSRTRNRPKREAEPSSSM